MIEELVFVMAPNQNHFFFELAEALQFEIERQHVRCSISKRGFPPMKAGRVYALLPPHEYFALEGGKGLSDRRLLKHTVFICAEQPGTSHFEENMRLANLGGALFDINRSSVTVYAKRGITARYLQLGYSPKLDHFPGLRQPSVDVVFMGAYTARRARVLAGCARQISMLRARLIISDNSRPNSGESAAFLVGQRKTDLLRDSRVILNIHQYQQPYFEWARVLDAIHSGCAIVTEDSLDCGPLLPGVHFAAARPQALGDTLEWLVRDDETRVRLSMSAYKTIKEELPLSKAVAELLDAGSEVDRRARRSVRHFLGIRQPPGTLGLPASPGQEGQRRIVPRTPYPADPETAELRRVLKDMRLDLLDLRRRLGQSALTPEGAGEAGAVRVCYRSLALQAGSVPVVSIITALYNHRSEVIEALDSVVASELTDFEVIVVDDGSTDEGLYALRSWGDSHPEIPLLVLQHPVNRGLPWARNAAIDAARSEYCFILDADNSLYPNALRDLASELERNRDASFAYGILAMHRRKRPVGLQSWYPWDPSRLRYGNYIDAMAMFRTKVLRSMSGYSTDRRLYGWEDYEMYCRLADNGYIGSFVAKIVGAYRVSPSSMRSLSDLSYASAFEALKEKCPRLMEGVIAPL